MAAESIWALEIVRKLEQRNNEEFYKQREIYDAYSRLCLQNESLSKEVHKLSYQRDQLQEDLDEKLASSSSVGGGGESGKRIEELKKQLEASEKERWKKNEKYTEVLERNVEIEKELTAVQGRLKEVEKSHQTSESSCEKLQHQVASLSQQLDKVQNQYTSTHQRLEKTQKDNDSLREKVSEHQQSLQDARDSKIKAEKSAHKRQLENQIHQAEVGTIATDRPRSTRSSSSNSKEATTPVRSAPKRPTSIDPLDSPRRGSAAFLPHTPSVKPEVPTCIWDAHDSDVTALCFSSSGQYVATGGSDKLVRVWPINDKGGVLRDDRNRIQLSGCKASILSLQFDDQQDQLVLGASNDQTARVWNLDDRKQLVRLKGHNDKVSAARFCERATKVVTGSLDRTVKIWDWKKETSLCTLFAGYSCTDVLVGKNSQWATLVTSHNDKQVRFWDLRTNTPNPIALGGKITSLDQSPDGRYLLCCCMDDTLSIIDMNQKSLYRKLKAASFHVPLEWSRAAFSPCGQYVAAGSADGSVLIWDVHEASNPAPSKIKQHRDQVVACCWHPKGSFFASIEKSKKCIIWGR